MSIDKSSPEQPKLSVIDGGGDPDAGRAGRIARARAEVTRAREVIETALGLRDDEPESPYGHRSPVPNPPEAPAAEVPLAKAPAIEPASAEPVSTEATEPLADVIPISRAPSHESNRPPDHTAEGTGALTEPPIRLNAEGEIDRKYNDIREARLNVDLAIAETPRPEASAIEDLMRQ